jgi:hypothetical protein
MSRATTRIDLLRRKGLVAFLCALLPLILSILACGLGGATSSPTTHLTPTVTSGDTTPVGGDSPTPTSTTSTPPPPPKSPTNTPVPPPPAIAGVYYGYYTTNGSSSRPPVGIQISQSGGSLSGASYEGSSISSNSGSIASNGSFTIKETFSGGVAYLHGAPAGGGHLSGSWDNGGSALGTWDVYASVAGGYSGSYTRYSSSGNSPMSMQITESGAALGGSTNESGSISSNSGSFTAGGSFTIQENFSGTLAYLRGTIVAPGHLSGTWDTGGAALGTWDVYHT